MTWTPGSLGRIQLLAGQEQENFRSNQCLEKNKISESLEATGKLEPLKENLSGFWSRRIVDTHRLGYCVDGENLVVVTYRYNFK